MLQFFLCMLAFYIWLIVLYFALSMFIYTRCAFALLAFSMPHKCFFIIFFSFHSHSCMFFSFHFISLLFTSVCSIKVAFLMPHSVFYCYLLWFCHACAKRKTNNTFETEKRSRIIKKRRMNHHSLQMSTIETIWYEIGTLIQHNVLPTYNFTCQL